MTFEFDNFEIHGDDDRFMVFVKVCVHVFAGTVMSVKIEFRGPVPPLTMSECQFAALFPGGQDVLNNAYEAEATNDDN